MRVIIDTNRYRDFCEAETEVIGVLQRVEEIYLPFIVLAELRAGFACGKKGPENEKFLVQFINKPRVRILFADEDTTRQYANLFRQLRTQGTPIPANDLWIASLAVQHDLFLFTRDIHFIHLPQIPTL